MPETTTGHALPAPAPHGAEAICRHCDKPINLDDATGHFVDLEGNASCGGNGWLIVGHEPKTLPPTDGVHFTEIAGKWRQRVYLLVDGDHAIEWTRSTSPIAIYHNATPVGGFNASIPCDLLDRWYCYADSQFLIDTDALTYASRDVVLIEKAMRAAWARTYTEATR
jgi:hypothetical protein